MFDAVRVPKLLADVAGLEQAIDADTRIVRSMTQLGQAVGDTTTTILSLHKQLSAFPSALSSELMPIQSGLPANPVAALGILKQAMFETGTAATESATRSTGRASRRITAAQEEQASALAISLVTSRSLPASSSWQEQIADTASGSGQLHADLAANSAARLALYHDVGGLHQLVAAWLSQRASLSALAHPTMAGGTVPHPFASTTDPAVPGASEAQKLQSAVDQLVSLHDGRVSAQALLGAYSALQQTVSSAGLANQFASAAEKSLQDSLSTLGLAAGPDLSSLETALRSLDASTWLDGGKDAQAQQASARLLASLASRGMIPSSVAAEGSSAGEQLQQAMSAWLDADKQRQYWAQLAQNARSSIAGLDQRLGALSDQAGIDLAGPAAAGTEAALLDRLKQDPAAARWQGLISTAARDPGARSVIQKVVAQ